MTREPASQRAPRFVLPQLATLCDRVPAESGWLHEVKYDGYRVECLIHGDQVRLMTRGHQDWTHRFAAIVAEVARLKVTSAVIDGEIVALDKAGRSSFQLLQRCLEEGASARIRYVVFDLLTHDGEDIRALPLRERRARLGRLLARHAVGHPDLTLSQELRGRGDAVLRRACRRGLEGVVSKRLDARYQGRRSRDWLKVKCGHRQEFVVVGYTLPKGSRRGLGALLVAVHDTRGHLHYAGRVGTGMSREVLLALRARLDQMRREHAPVVDPPAGTGVSWTRPHIVVEVAFTEWTSDARLRHPSFIGVRVDKAASDVRREKP